MDRGRPDMRIAQEEIFGPVLTVLSFDSEAEAVKIANETSYGLAAGIWTRDIKRAHRVARQLRVGRVGLNVHAPPDPTMPTGGFSSRGGGASSAPTASTSTVRSSRFWRCCKCHEGDLLLGGVLRRLH
jgi:acyl-CoA reductase-like NAD-dependent aldehyde dehydrogenase